MLLLHHPVALDELYRMALLREAWTDIGDVGVVRRAGLGKIGSIFVLPRNPRRAAAAPAGRPRRAAPGGTGDASEKS